MISSNDTPEIGIKKEGCSLSILNTPVFPATDLDLNYYHWPPTDSFVGFK